MKIYIVELNSRILYADTKKLKAHAWAEKECQNVFATIQQIELNYDYEDLNGAG